MESLKPAKQGSSFGLHTHCSNRGRESMVFILVIYYFTCHFGSEFIASLWQNK
jgi:hypothetical protein